jgi:hypothetical protein
MNVSYAVFTEGGDDVMFDGTERALNWAKIGIFNGALVPDTGDLTLTLYNLDGGFQGSRPLPGTVIAVTKLTNLTLAPGDNGLIQFDFGGVIVPDQLAWAIIVGGAFDPYYIATQFYKTPTVGKTTFGFCERFYGEPQNWSYWQMPGNPVYYGDFEAQFDARPVPEPASFMFLALGAAALLRRRSGLR